MNKLLLITVILLVLLAETFLASSLFSATYNLTGTWNYTLSDNWAYGDLGCDPGSPATGTCSIVQTGDAFTFAYTSGVVCDPIGACSFEGSVDGATYTCSTTDIVDDEGGTVTSTITFTATSATSTGGSGSSYYTHPTDDWQCFWGSNIALIKSDVPPVQYTLTVNTAGGGTVTLDPQGGIYNAGTQVQLTAVPDSGWAFDYWSGDVDGSQNPVMITMDENKTVSTIFIMVRRPTTGILHLLLLD